MGAALGICYGRGSRPITLGVKCEVELTLAGEVRGVGTRQVVHPHGTLVGPLICAKIVEVCPREKPKIKSQ